MQNGHCFAVAPKDAALDFSDEKINWICEDDFDMFWENNCMPVRPLIDSCIDELSLAKQHGDPEILRHVLDKHSMMTAHTSTIAEEEPDQSAEAEKTKPAPESFYKFHHLGHLFLGRCVKIDGTVMCPSAPVKVSDFSEQAGSLAKECRVFDNVIACRHNIEETFKGGNCLMAGYTYICTDDIPQILESKCIDFSYDSFAGLSSKHLCGRDMLDFLSGLPFEIRNKLNPSLYKEIKVYTASEISMTSPNCMEVDGFNLCWHQSNAVAKPFEFMDNKCKVIDGEIWCLDKVRALYEESTCVRYLMDWICAD